MSKPVKQERIICAAYRFKEGYRTPYMEKLTEKDGTMIEDMFHGPCRETFKMAMGWRHPDIRYKYNDVIDTSDLGGFMTSFGRYVDRKEAAKIAFAAGQIEKEKAWLFSEDLY